MSMKMRATFSTDVVSVLCRTISPSLVSKTKFSAESVFPALTSSPKRRNTQKKENITERVAVIVRKREKKKKEKKKKKKKKKDFSSCSHNVSGRGF